MVIKRGFGKGLSVSLLIFSVVLMLALPTASAKDSPMKTTCGFSILQPAFGTKNHVSTLQSASGTNSSVNELFFVNGTSGNVGIGELR